MLVVVSFLLLLKLTFILLSVVKNVVRTDQKSIHVQ